MDTAAVLLVFQGSVPRVLPTTGSTSNVGTVSTARTQSTKILPNSNMRSELGVSSIPRPSVHRFHSFIPILLLLSMSDGPKRESWSELLSRGATGVLKIAGSTSGVYTASTHSI